jgi:hypothetical protein
MKLRSLAAVFFLLGVAVCALAEGTRIWEQSRFEEFEKGTARGVAIDSNGRLELAPSFKPLATTPSTYIWSIAVDERGTAYLAAGAPARVYAVTPDGKSTVIFEPQELQVQSLVVDSEGSIYAATSPDGKVYRLQRRTPGSQTEKDREAGGTSGEKAKTSGDSGWTSSVFYDPKTKYIWALALDREGRLYVATGDRGEIFRVDPNGRGEVFFKTDEAHIRALAFDPQGNLIAGSDGSGLIYRISPQGQAFVLYSAPKKEITALVVDPRGNIYAAGVGEKHAPGIPVPAAPAGPPAPAGAAPGAVPRPGGAPGTAAAPAAPLPGNIPFPALGAVGSEIYRIAPDGSPRLLWASRDDLVYALGFDAQGHLLAGSGNKGRIFLIEGEQQFTDLLKASASQVTGFAKLPNGDVYLCTSNLGKIFLLGDGPQAEGTYESDVFDAHTFSRWGRAQVRGRGAFELWARSGNVDNPDRNWSPWVKVELHNGSPLGVPAARFVQWKAVLRPAQPLPQIDSVGLFYLPKNVAPVIDDVIVQVGARFPPPPPKPAVESFPSPAPHPEPAPQLIRDHNAVAVRWLAHDDNDDQLVYSLYYRGDGETNWKLLKDKITEKYYSFDAGLLPDGGYTVKVVASDAPSNSPETALTKERESHHFEVDTTPPRIDDLKAFARNGELHISFQAVDGFSAIKRAECSLDAGEWQLLQPVGQISDSRTEKYDFTLPEPGAQRPKTDDPAAPDRHGHKLAKAAADPEIPAATEHLVVVRVWDRFDNMATAKTVIHTK